jgi:alpha-beta hydrolase superfamily lysophospholipase
VGEAYFADPLVLRRVTAGLGADILAAGDRVRQQLAQLAVPTLVLHGGLDPLVPPTVSVDLESSPLVERRLYLKLRHELFNEPEGPQILDEVVDWLRHKLV